MNRDRSGCAIVAMVCIGAFVIPILLVSRYSITDSVTPSTGDMAQGFASWPDSMRLSSVGGLYRREKLLITDAKSHRLDGLRHWIRSDIAAESLSDAGTLVRIERTKFVAGKYQGGGEARRRVHTIRLYDIRDSAYIGAVDFHGGDPPRYSALGEATGKAPERDTLIDFLQRLPVWHANIAEDYTLLRAAAGESVDSVRASLARGADPLFKNVRGQTALSIAAGRWESRHDILAELMARKFEPNVLNEVWGASILTLLIQAKHLDLARQVLAAGADVNLRGRQGGGGPPGDTPLIKAVRVGDLSLVEAILDRRPDLSASDDFGNPPLHLAVRSRNAEIVAAILDAGANPKEKALDGKRPLDLIGPSDTTIARLLKQPRKYPPR